MLREFFGACELITKDDLWKQVWNTSAWLYRLSHDVRTFCSLARWATNDNPEIIPLVSVPQGKYGEFHFIR
jgi:hypothetical protein